MIDKYTIQELSPRHTQVTPASLLTVTEVFRTSGLLSQGFTPVEIEKNLCPLYVHPH